MVVLTLDFARPSKLDPIIDSDKELPGYSLISQSRQNTSSALFTMSELLGSLLNQFFLPKPVWTSKDVPDQIRKTALVTGSNGGIGRKSQGERQESIWEGTFTGITGPVV